MTKGNSEKFCVRICNCGKIGRPKSIKSHSVKENHNILRSFTCCVKCCEIKDVLTTTSEFEKEHGNCGSVPTTSTAFRAALSDYLKKEGISIPTSVESVGDLIEEAAQASGIISPPRKRVRVESDSSISDIDVPNASSTPIPRVEKSLPEAVNASQPTGIQLQNTRWVEDQLIAKVSQETSLQHLTAKYRSLDATHRRILDENTKLSCTVKQYQKFKTENEGLVFKCKNFEDQLKRIRKDSNDTSAKLSETQSALAQQIDNNAVLEKKIKELNDLLSASTKEKEEFDLHIPLVNNTVAGEVKYTSSPDETEYCYRLLDMSCLHAHLRINGTLESMTFRKSKAPKRPQ